MLQLIYTIVIDIGMDYFRGGGYFKKGGYFWVFVIIV